MENGVKISELDKTNVLSGTEYFPFANGGFNGSASPKAFSAFMEEYMRVSSPTKKGLMSSDDYKELHTHIPEILRGTAEDSSARTDPFISKSLNSWGEVSAFADGVISQLSRYMGTTRILVNGSWLVTLNTTLRINGDVKICHQQISGFMSYNANNSTFGISESFRTFARVYKKNESGVTTGTWEEILSATTPKNFGKSVQFFGGSQTQHAFSENSTEYKFKGRFPLAKELINTLGVNARCSAREGAGFCTPGYGSTGWTIPITRQAEECTPCEMYVFWLGTNDYSTGQNFGSPSDPKATVEQLASGEATAVSAFKYCVDKLIKRNRENGLPSPKFFLITPLRTSYGPVSEYANKSLGNDPFSKDSRSMAAYTNIMKRVAVQLSIPVLDLFTNSNLELNRGETFTIGSDGAGNASGYFFDGTHLSVEGYEELSKPISDFIANEYHYVDTPEPERHTSAYSDDYISLGNFDSIDALKTALDKMAGNGVDTDTAIKHCGRNRAMVNGINIEVYQFVTSYVAKHFTQLVFGNVYISPDDKTKIVQSGAGVFNMLTRPCVDGVWGNWSKYGGNEASGGGSVSGSSYEPGYGLYVNANGNISVNAGSGIRVDENNKVTLSQTFLNLLLQMANTNGNGAGLKYTEDGLLTIDTGEGLEIAGGKLVATGGTMDPVYKDYLDAQLEKEFDAKFAMNLTASKTTIEKGVETAVTLTGTATNTTGKQIESIVLSIGTSEVKRGTTSPQTYNHTASDGFTAKATLKLSGYAKTKEKSVTVNAYYPIYTGVSTKETLSSSDFGTALTKYGTISNTAVRKYSYTIPVGGGYPYLAVPTGVTSPTKILVLGSEAGMYTQTDKVTVNGVQYTVFRPTAKQGAGAVDVQYA